MSDITEETCNGTLTRAAGLKVLLYYGILSFIIIITYRAKLFDADWLMKEDF
jgi:hypothetical protein